MSRPNYLSLPVDIPWVRKCSTEDTNISVSNPSVPRWRSSIAVFEFEPNKDEQLIPGQTVSYLKIVCTITGYQENPDMSKLTGPAWKNPNAIANYQSVLEEYYPCKGALLEVSVVPKDTKTKTEDYPYFTDFEPKKREMYQYASETNESLSRTLENVKVNRGTTTSQSHEIVDILGGVTASGGGGGGQGSIGVNGQWGTRDVSQSSYSDVRTSDAGRELRENYSYTTSLTQMYHQLNSYHLGTNRAMFMMLPRPHTLRTEQTVVNGPRDLEGVQEFLLVMMRPENVKQTCVHVNLETSHLGLRPVYDYETRTDEDTLSFTHRNSATDKNRDDNDDTWDPKEKTQVYRPPPGWEIDVRRNGGYEEILRTGNFILNAEIRDVSKDSLTLYGRINAKFWDDASWTSDNDIYEDGSLNYHIRIFLKAKSQHLARQENVFWMTQRSLKCCDKTEISTGFVYEVDFTDIYESAVDGLELEPRKPDILSGVTDLTDPIPNDFRVDYNRTKKKNGKRVPKLSGPMTAAKANGIQRGLEKALRRSIGSPKRHEAGKVSFKDSHFFMSKIAHAAVPSLKASNPKKNGVESLTEMVTVKRGKSIPLSKLLFDAPSTLSVEMGVSTNKLFELREAALGLAQSNPIKKEKP